VINPDLHKKPVALDRVAHRTLKVRRDQNALQATAGLNSFFLTGAEFADACKEYPIFFLRAGTDKDGKPLCAPVAVFGLAKGENLFLRGDRWDARYVPALLRAYPFAMAPTGEGQQHVMVIDQSSGVLSTEVGEPLFKEDGAPSAFLEDLRQFTERVEVEVERTRLAGRKLMEMNLLQDRRFDATLPDGTKLSVDGFMAADEERLKALSDAEVVDLHRSGLLAMLHLHLVSMSNMTQLLQRRLDNAAAATRGNGAA
jgi:SapC